MRPDETTAAPAGVSNIVETSMSTQQNSPLRSEYKYVLVEKKEQVQTQGRRLGVDCGTSARCSQPARVFMAN